LKIEIRHAEQADFQWLCDQCLSFSEFFESQHQLFGGAEHREQLIESLIKYHLLLISWNGEERTGFIAGYVVPHLFNPKIETLTEILWWVSEEHRGSRAGLMLFNAFMDWGRANVHWVTMSLEEKSPIKDSFLIKRGFKLKEKSYLLEVA